MSVFGLPEWFSQAPCKSASDEFFSSKPSEQRKAVKVCNSCQFLDTCKEWALTNPHDYGVWGGMTPADLRKIRDLTSTEDETRLLS